MAQLGLNQRATRTEPRCDMGFMSQRSSAALPFEAAVREAGKGTLRVSVTQSIDNQRQQQTAENARPWRRGRLPWETRELWRLGQTKICIGIGKPFAYFVLPMMVNPKICVGVMWHTDQHGFIAFGNTNKTNDTNIRWIREIRVQEQQSLWEQEHE